MLSSTYNPFLFFIGSESFDNIILYVQMSQSYQIGRQLINLKLITPNRLLNAAAIINLLYVDVNHLDDRPLGLLFQARWTALGTVGHWGHIHTCKNQYEADITVEPVGGNWKITGLELLEGKRIDPYGAAKSK